MELFILYFNLFFLVFTKWTNAFSRRIVLNNYLNFNEIDGTVINKSNYKLGIYTEKIIKFRQTFP